LASFPFLSCIVQRSQGKHDETAALGTEESESKSTITLTKADPTGQATNQDESGHQSELSADALQHQENEPVIQAIGVMIPVAPFLKTSIAMDRVIDWGAEKEADADADAKLSVCHNDLELKENKPNLSL